LASSEKANFAIIGRRLEVQQALIKTSRVSPVAYKVYLFPVAIKDARFT
jgi:hypothetical protein